MRALITGASEGIGGAIAQALAHDARQRGQTPRLALVASGRNAPPEALIGRLRDGGAEVHYFVGDLAEPRDCRAVARVALEALGGIEALVSNAGAMGGAPLRDIEIAQWDRLFAINVRATLLIAQQLHEALRDSKGAIVATSSMAARFPLPGGGAYSASKAALDMLVRQLAQEWGPQGIRVNAVAPGMIRTPLTEKIYDDPEIAARRDGQVALGRVGSPEDIAGVVAFLCGPAARYVTGEIVLADGGMTDGTLGRMPGAVGD